MATNPPGYTFVTFSRTTVLMKLVPPGHNARILGHRDDVVVHRVPLVMSIHVIRNADQLLTTLRV